jgi:hypothetical protein
MLHSLSRRTLSRQLSSKGRTFPGPFEALAACTGPRNSVPGSISNGYDSIIKCSLNMSYAIGNVFLFFFLTRSGHYSSI